MTTSEQYNECCKQLGDAVVKKEALDRLIENLKLQITDLQVSYAEEMRSGSIS